MNAFIIELYEIRLDNAGRDLIGMFALEDELNLLFKLETEMERFIFDQVKKERSPLSIHRKHPAFFFCSFLMQFLQFLCITLMNKLFSNAVEPTLNCKVGRIWMDSLNANMRVTSMSEDLDSNNLFVACLTLACYELEIDVPRNISFPPIDVTEANGGDGWLLLQGLKFHPHRSKGKR